jgi:hypothetical protein
LAGKEEGNADPYPGVMEAYGAGAAAGKVGMAVLTDMVKGMDEPKWNSTRNQKEMGLPKRVRARGNF